MPAEVFRFEQFELDRNTHELRRDGQGVHLERIPFELLTLLVERGGQLVTREEIIEHIWGKGVFHDTEHGINTAVRKIRQALEDNTEVPHFVLTVPAKGYRFVAPVHKMEPAPVPAPSAAVQIEGAASVASDSGLSQRRIFTVALVFLTTTGLGAYLYFHRAQALSEKDTIVLADFTNNTGDPVFDDTLKQALWVDLSQSPFLNILSEEKVGETLQMMGHSEDERVNERTAKEICQRRQSAAVLGGSIAKLGNEYVIGINLVSCGTGEVLAKEQLRAHGKEEVLKTLDQTATKLRGRLGESLSTIQKFDVPVEQATTRSLEALQAYSLGRKNLKAGNFVAALPAFQTSVNIDPNFAMAYAGLGTTYSNLGEMGLAAENTKKAFALREQIGERERLYIESHYDMFVTGNIEKGTQVFELWEQLYPRDVVPPFNLAAGYGNIGQFDKALQKSQEALRLEPDSALNYAFLAFTNLAMNRAAEARVVAAEAQAKNLDSPALHVTLYGIAFAQNDLEGMEREVSWATNKHGVEDILLACSADAAAYFGKLKEARELSRRAMVSAQQADKKELSAAYQAGSALRESLFGNSVAARAEVITALGIARSADLLFMAALVRSRAEDTTGAQAIINEEAKRFPEDSIVQFIYVPTVRAQIATERGHVASAIEILQTAAPYELGAEGGCGFAIALYPIYVRGEAYLAAQRGAEAASEFQKILDHRGATLMAPISALAPLGLARAYAIQGEESKARVAYLDFLALWKDADPDIPVLKQAKAEYARLAL